MIIIGVRIFRESADIAVLINMEQFSSLREQVWGEGRAFAIVVGRCQSVQVK